MKKEIGNVSVEERDVIQALFERRNGLNELAQIISSDNDVLYNKLVKDLGETASKFQNWWNDMSNKYVWESSPNGHWEIDFNSCKIFLVTPE